MAFCTNCGNPISESDVYCMHCGEKVWVGEEDRASAGNEDGRPEAGDSSSTDSAEAAEAEKTRAVFVGDDVAGKAGAVPHAPTATETPDKDESANLAASYAAPSAPTAPTAPTKPNGLDEPGTPAEPETSAADAAEAGAASEPAEPAADAPEAADSAAAAASAPDVPEADSPETVESLNANTKFDATRFVADEEVDFGPSTAMGSGPFGSGPSAAGFYASGPHSGPGASGPFVAPGQQHSDTVYAGGQNGVYSSGPTGDTTTSPLTTDNTTVNNGFSATNKIIIAVSAIVAIVAIAIAVVVLSSRATISPDSNTNTSNASETPTHTVHFETSGGSTVPSTRIKETDTLTSPEEPTKPGYDFVDWYYDKDFKKKADFPLEDVTEDVTLYAKWEEADASSGGSTPSPEPNPSASSSATSTTQQSAQDVVTLTIYGTDGTSRTGQIHREGDSQRVFADSNERYLSDSEIYALSDIEKCVAWNEIVASSNGYVFKNADLAAYFSNCSWYYPTPGASAGGNIDHYGNAQANIDRLQAACDDWFRYKLT